MNIEDIVNSIEYAKELKTLGVPQESLFYWLKLIGATKWKVVDKEEIREADIIDDLAMATFTPSEHLKKMPATLEQENQEYNLIIDKIKVQGEEIYTVSYSYNNYELEGEEHLIQYSDYKFVDALAKMRIYLIKNKLI